MPRQVHGDINTLVMRTNRGFTLIELLIVMVIASILAAITIPTMQFWVQDNRLSAQTNEFISDLHLARTEAIKRNRRVTICKSSDLTSCDVGNNLNWTQGWITFVDNAPADGILNAGEQLIRSHPPALGDVQYAPRAADTTIQYYISFIPRGVTQLVVAVAGSRTQTGFMRVCDDRGVNEARAVLISQTGRVSSVGPPNAAATVGACP